MSVKAPHLADLPHDRWSARVGRAANSLATAYKLRNCTSVGEGTRVTGHVWVHGGGRIVLGQRIHLDASGAPIELHCFPSAEIQIGDDVVIEGGTSIEAMRSISIGAGTRIRMHCKIIDGHFHALEGHRQEFLPPGQVTIHAGVNLEPYSIVVASQVGEGAVVGARTVVTRRVRPNTLIRGFPAVTEARRKP